jgi:trans-aconitate 2-methyltransferase
MSGQKPVEWDAKAYDKLSDPQFAWGTRLLATVTLRGDERVMDAGCGSGRLTEELLKRLPNGHVVAADLSANMLESARERLRGAKKRVELARCDLSNFRLPEPLDGIFSNATLHWVPDHASMFRSFFRALKPGGWLVAQFGGDGNLARLKARAAFWAKQVPFAKFITEMTDPTHYATEAETRQHMEAAGFAEIVTGLHPELVRFPGADAMQLFVEKVNLHKYIAALPDDLAHQFVVKLVEEAAKDDPPYTLDYMRLSIRAKKPA